jgi:hypothetical protein
LLGFKGLKDGEWVSTGFRGMPSLSQHKNALKLTSFTEKREMFLRGVVTRFYYGSVFLAGTLLRTAEALPPLLGSFVVFMIKYLLGTSQFFKHRHSFPFLRRDFLAKEHRTSTLPSTKVICIQTKFISQFSFSCCLLFDSLLINIL